MTDLVPSRCQFELTIPAEKLDPEDRICSKSPTKNIAGFDEGYPVALDFCDEHYQIVSRFLEEPQK